MKFPYIMFRVLIGANNYLPEITYNIGRKIFRPYRVSDRCSFFHAFALIKSGVMYVNLV